MELDCIQRIALPLLYCTNPLYAVHAVELNWIPHVGLHAVELTSLHAVENTTIHGRYSRKSGLIGGVNLFME